MKDAKDILLNVLRQQAGLSVDDARSSLLLTETLLSEGWEPEDVQRYLFYTEEISPDLNEDFALRGMRDIRKKYERS